MPSVSQAPVVCFLDESATDANDSDFAVLGGIVMNRKDLPEFEAAWASMLSKHKLPVLHMIDLGPNGPYPQVSGDACNAMLTDAVKAVNTCRVFSFGATWDNRAHEVLFSAPLRKKHFSVYGLVFLMAVEINRASAVRAEYGSVIDYVLDTGNKFRRHIEQMYGSMKSVPELADHKVGSVTFDEDSKVFGLQAADVIAWATRRHFSGRGLTGVHQPLEGLFDKFYVHSAAPPNLIEVMSARFAVAEMNIDPDSMRGWLLLKRRPVFLVLLSIGVVVLGLSPWFGSSLLWSGIGLLAASTASFLSLDRRLKRSA